MAKRDRFATVMFTSIVRSLASSRLLTIIAFGIAWASHAAQADMRIGRTKPLTIAITGKISARDAAAFERLEGELQKDRFEVWLNSMGGDVAAAIRIGRLVRKYWGWTIIDHAQPLRDDDPAVAAKIARGETSRCYSRCALIFIGGVYRSNFGELGLHRPYLAGSSKDRETIEREVSLMLSSVKNYVGEMGVTDQFFQQMINTEPSKMVVYRSDDASMLVPEYDPTYEAIQISRDARGYEITMDELRGRRSQAEHCSVLQIGIARFSCEEAFAWGLSEPVYRERYSKNEQMQFNRHGTCNCPYIAIQGQA